MDIKGTKLPTPQRSELEWIRGQGWTSVDTWEGPTMESVNGLIPGLQAAGYTRIRRYSPDSIKWRVEAHLPKEQDGVADQPVDTWQLLGQSQSKDILTHPNFAGISDAQIRVIRDAAENPTGTTSPNLTVQAEIDLYTLMLRQVRSYSTSQHVLRHTSNVATMDDVDIAMDGKDKLFLTGDLPPLDTAMSKAINDIPNTFGDVTGFLWSWLKQAPTITVDIFGRVSIDVEWWLGSWPLSIYQQV